MRGKNKAGHVQESKIRQQHELIRDRNKIALMQDYKRAKVQTEAMTADLEFLNKMEGKFDPFEAAIQGKTAPEPKRAQEKKK